MRRVRTLALLTTVGLSLPVVSPGVADAARPAPDRRVLQPVESERGLVATVAGRRLKVETPGERPERLQLRKRERMLTLAETRQGWIAAGIRPAGRHSDLTILTSDLGGRRRIAPPPLVPGQNRTRPVLLLEEGNLAGIAWLEGPEIRKMSVRAAAWTGVDWEPPVTVAAARQGSQSGLAGAVLEDGSWLLVWSAHDGEDDELLWSHRRGEAWSAPRLLHPGNREPDITAALVAGGDGALVAWSRIDGEGYRLFSSRFDGAGWEPPSRLGPAASLYPSFHRQKNSTRLLFRTALPGPGWGVLDLGERGETRHQTLFDEPEAGRPAVVESGASGVTLQFPDGSRVEPSRAERRP